VPGFLGWLETPAGRVARISSAVTFCDRAGAWKVRWGIGRNDFKVPAGLYALGTPGPDGPVVVTANYKMSYDIIRRELRGRNVWMLVLETFGINVWCAAGKGSFGTEELINRIAATKLDKVVSHRRLILPILGAPGVAAHEISRQTGFTIKYGTIRASDLPEYLDNGNVTTPAMKELTFTFMERLVLVPIELVIALKPTAFIGGLLFLLFTIFGGITAGRDVLVAYIGAAITGIVIGPLFLPLLPSRSFAVKGAVAGIAWSVLLYLLAGGGWSLPVTLAAFIALPAVSAFYTLNFTGCTTYTSRSGVKKEMRVAIPATGCAVITGLILTLAAKLF
jgi:hypothetical protein